MQSKLVRLGIMLLLCSLLAITLWGPNFISAQGDFPNWPILDDFNRINEGPPPSINWTQESLGGMVVLTDELALDIGASNSQNYWNLNQYSDGEVYITTVIRPDYEGAGLAWVTLFARDNPGIGALSLSFIRDDVNGDYLEVSDCAALDEIISQEWADGDSFGMAISGTEVIVYYDSVTTGIWQSLNSYTFDCPASGYFGLGIYDVAETGATRLDNFGAGGTIIEIPTPTPTPTLTATAEPGATWTPEPTWTPAATWTPEPTWTPAATWTPGPCCIQSGIMTITLTSGNILTILPSINFGEAIIGGLLLILAIIGSFTILTHLA